MSKNQAGKGSKPRPYKIRTYEKNYDWIFRKNKKERQNHGKRTSNYTGSNN